LEVFADPLGKLDDRLDQPLPLEQSEVVVVGARDLHDTRLPGSHRRDRSALRDRLRMVFGASERLDPLGREPVLVRPGAAVHSLAAAASPHERTTGTASASGAGSRRGSGAVGLRVKDAADLPLENAICSIFAHNRRLCDTPARPRRDLLGPDLGDVAEDLTPAHSRAHSGGTARFASASRDGARYRHHRAHAQRSVRRNRDMSSTVNRRRH
jgi:hypothetical protein